MTALHLHGPVLLNCNPARYHSFIALYGHIHLTAPRSASHFPDPDTFLGFTLYWSKMWASLSPTFTHAPAFSCKEHVSKH